MNLSLYLFSGAVAALLVLLYWALRSPAKKPPKSAAAPLLEELARRHVSSLPQIQQALAKTDCDFLRERGRYDLQRRLRRERRQIALAYLSALRADFHKLLRIARILAALSPEVAVLQELERVRLTVGFHWRFLMLRLQLLVGLTPMAPLSGLSNLVSGLSVRMETAMKEIGERAALAAELASSVDRRGSNLA